MGLKKVFEKKNQFILKKTQDIVCNLVWGLIEINLRTCFYNNFPLLLGLNFYWNECKKIYWQMKTHFIWKYCCICFWYESEFLEKWVWESRTEIKTRSKWKTLYFFCDGVWIYWNGSENIQAKSSTFVWIFRCVSKLSDDGRYHYENDNNEVKMNLEDHKNIIYCWDYFRPNKILPFPYVNMCCCSKWK